MTVSDDWEPRMHEAFEADNETGSHHLNNLASEEFARKYPTILAVSLHIEQQRDALLAQLELLKAAVKALKKGQNETTVTTDNVCQ